ncbi:hypothetical protein [Bdellovibrio sp. HCB-110]|uniref:hypothetical protein n=1 Tax=Bdellovibrio sp. HCB-110 TaxID=3391182 RepID=UPI0039B5FF85
MDSEIIVKKLTNENLADYEKLTKHGDDGNLCYCSFWHQKWASMDEYKKIQKENPERLKSCVIDRVKSGFHVGIIAYEKNIPIAWVCVGPLIDFYWAWQRVVQIGEKARTTAGILCFAVPEEFRNQGTQKRVLLALKEYGKTNGWSAIEAYPFSDYAIAKYGKSLLWAGRRKKFEQAGFKLVGEHWLSSSDVIRHIYKMPLTLSEE